MNPLYPIPEPWASTVEPEFLGTFDEVDYHRYFYNRSYFLVVYGRYKAAVHPSHADRDSPDELMEYLRAHYILPGFKIPGIVTHFRTLAKLLS